MSAWPSSRGREVLSALLRLGWRVKRTKGSHHTLAHPSRPDYRFAFGDASEIGPRMLARIAKHTGLKPEDL